MNKYCLLLKKRIIEQAKFSYSTLGKAFEKHTKTIEIKEKTSVCFNDFRTKRQKGNK